MPAKQEAGVGVNAGDLILIRLEEKPKRRQFEIAAQGAWRSSSGISLTHQIQLLWEEVNPGVYRIMPATELGQGEYALYLARGENLTPFVYDFGVQPPSPVRNPLVLGCTDARVGRTLLSVAVDLDFDFDVDREGHDVAVVP